MMKKTWDRHTRTSCSSIFLVTRLTDDKSRLIEYKIGCLKQSDGGDPRAFFSKKFRHFHPEVLGVMFYGRGPFFFQYAIDLSCRCILAFHTFEVAENGRAETEILGNDDAGKIGYF